MDNSNEDVTQDHEYEIPQLIYEERVFLEGYFYDVFLEIDPDGSYQLYHWPVYYTCWDGQFPF